MLHRLLGCSATSLKLVPPPSGCSTSLNGTHLGVASPSQTSGSQPRWLFNSCEWLQFHHVLFQVAVSALLGDTPKLVEYGTALMSNLATKEVAKAFDLFLVSTC